MTGRPERRAAASAAIPRGDVAGAEMGVAQDEGQGAVLGVGRSAVAQRPQRDARRGRPRQEDVLGAVPRGQSGDDVQARRDAADRRAGEVLVERGHQGVPAFPVGPLAASQLPVVAAAHDEVGQDGLVDHRIAQIHGPFAGDDPLGERGGGDQPAEPQAGSQ
ncbi:hypothetical protein QF048_006491 [Streptomyces sp. W4I9-2]|nr:hypothetical protein [Streptomyces sp. W4I9-2]